MTSNITINLAELHQNPVSLFKGKSQKIIFITVSIIAALASTALVIGAIVCNMPLLCLGLILLFSIVLLSFLLLSNLSKLKISPKEESDNITSPFTPKTTFLTKFCSQINTQTTCSEAITVLNEFKKELGKQPPANFPQVRTLYGSLIFPSVIPKENKSTAIVAFLGLNSASITKQNVTERSWESATNPNLPQGAVSSGYVEYKNPEHNKKYPFVRLLIQGNGTLISPGYNPKKFIKVLKTTYLNIFAICEEEGINIIQLPASGYCLNLEGARSDDENTAYILNQIAYLEALSSFNFSSVKTIYFVSQQK